jgi:hypothetical protein
MIQIKSIAVIYVRTVRKQNKSQVSRLPACSKSTNGSAQNGSWTRFRRFRNPWVLLTTPLLDGQTNLQTH